MLYEKRKEITAVLSLISVGLAVGAASWTTLTGRLTSYSVFYANILAVTIAAGAAWLSIVVSRRLKIERERRRVFLVYAREDLEEARKLTENLRDNGFNPWLDVNEITPGQVWQQAVLRALEESAVALVLVSKNLSKKGFVQKELDVAVRTLQEREKDVSPVIPVRLDDSPVPESLKRVQWVDLSDKHAMESLVAGLKRATK